MGKEMYNANRMYFVKPRMELTSVFYYEGYSCPVCKRPFSPHDDVVACPKCGLPHHRACWFGEGHCHLEHLHNTDEQWSREKAAQPTEPVRESVENLPYQICPRCHTKNPEFAEICTHCGMLLRGDAGWNSSGQAGHAYGEYRPYQSAVPSQDGIDPNEEIDGIKATDLAAVVDYKKDYYLPRFRRLGNGGRASWNWAAFWLGPFWLLYRKMYGYGVALLVLQLIESAMTYVAYGALGINSATSPEKMIEILMSSMMSSNSMIYFGLSISLISAIMTVIKVMLGLFGNKLYLMHCTKTVRRARETTPDLTASEFTTVGGTSVAMAIIGYFAVYFVTQLLAMFLIT